MSAGPPPVDVVVPSAVRRLAGDDGPRPVWANELGGLTFELEWSGRRCFVKWAPIGAGLDLSAEAARMRWAAAFTPVPEVLEEGGDGDGAWLLTAALPGESAVSMRWRARPQVAVRALGEGLRALHDALPVSACPFSWSAQERVALARRRAVRGLAPLRWSASGAGMQVSRALAFLDHPPPVDRLVVCHGDPCAPNTLIDEHGRWSGHVDLEHLGVADRWADLAIATWTTDYNYGPGWEDALLAAYGADRDHERARYYRVLWDMT
jgi:kanamycin kinase